MKGKQTFKFDCNYNLGTNEFNYLQYFFTWQVHAFVKYVAENIFRTNEKVKREERFTER